jgi:hypothetical protein
VRLLASFALAGALLAIPVRARAQACCTAVGSSELGVVGPRHQAVIAAQLGWDHAYGSVDQRRRYRRLQQSEVDDGILTLGGGVRPGPSWLGLQANLPLRVQHRALSGLPAADRVGFGDASLSLRFLVLQDPVLSVDLGRPESLRPFLEPFVGVRVPTGRGPDASKEASGADVTGDGAWAVFAGTTVTKFFGGHHALLLAGSYAHRFAHDVSAGGGTQRYLPGDELDARAGYLHAPSLFWSWSVFSTLRRAGRPSYDGEPVADADTLRIRFGASLQHSWSYPRWQVQLGVAFDPPADGFAKNVPFASSSLTLGVQRNFAR